MANVMGRNRIYGDVTPTLNLSNPRLLEMLDREAANPNTNRNNLSVHARVFMSENYTPDLSDPFARRGFPEVWREYRNKTEARTMSDAVNQRVVRTDGPYHGVAADPAWNNAQQAIDYEQVERLRHQMMNATTHSMQETWLEGLGKRIDESHADLLEWLNKFAEEENVSIFDIIMGVCIYEMQNPRLEKEPTAIEKLNIELNQMKEESNNGKLDGSGKTGDQSIPF